MEEQDWTSVEMIDLVHLLNEPQPPPKPSKLIQFQSLDIIGAGTALKCHGRIEGVAALLEGGKHFVERRTLPWFVDQDFCKLAAYGVGMGKASISYLKDVCIGGSFAAPHQTSEKEKIPVGDGRQKVNAVLERSAVEPFEEDVVFEDQNVFRIGLNAVSDASHMRFVDPLFAITRVFSYEGELHPFH